MDTKENTNGWHANYIEEYTEILEAIKETEKRPNHVHELAMRLLWACIGSALTGLFFMLLWLFS